MIKHFYNEYLSLKEIHNFLFPYFSRKVSPFFENIYQETQGVLDEKQQEELFEILGYRTLLSDFFVFNTLSVIKDLPSEKWLIPLLNRVTLYQNAHLQNMRNLERIYNGELLETTIHELVISSNNSLELYFYLLLLYSNPLTGLSRNYIWEDGRFKNKGINVEQSVKLEKNIIQLLQKRSEVILGLVQQEYQQEEIIMILKALFPRREHIRPEKLDIYDRLCKNFIK